MLTKLWHTSLTKQWTKATAMCQRSLSHTPEVDYDAVIRSRQEHLSPAMLAFYRKPLIITRGNAQFLWDHEEKKYLDLFGGIVTVSVGHCHPKVNAALKAQAEKLWHTTAIYYTEPMQGYAEKLLKTLPDGLDVVYFVNSGSEANDLALLMARMYTGRFDVLTMRHGYHGLTQALQGATALGTWRQDLPAGFGIQKVMNADPYRGPWGGRHCRDSVAQPNRACDCAANRCRAADMYLEQFRETLRCDVPNKGIAGYMVESIQGVGGTIQFPKTYIKRAFELVRAKGGVCIADEVQTGFGRMGDKYWGFETHDVLPDIVTMAKGIGNGFPMGAVVTSKKIADMLKGALHFNTYGGNPLACVVGEAVLDVIEEEGLQENCKTLGNYFIGELDKMRAKSTIIGDVRGKGLMIGVELVNDKETRTPLDPSRMADLFEKVKEKGVLMGKGGLYGNVLRIKPPMCITKADVDTALDVLEKVLCK